MALPSAYGEESPEALRRRADILLDEMMLGGVDVASAGPPSGNGVYYQSQPAEVGQGNGGADRGTNGQFDAYSSRGYGSSYSEPGLTSSIGSEQSSTTVQTSGAQLISAEERYAQYTGAPSAPQSSTAAPPETSWDSQTGVDAESAAPSSVGLTGMASSSAVRRQSTSVASTMAVGMRAANRSTLLPRNSEIDVNAVQQEINDLLRTVATSLPPGNEAVERSRHLLNKAEKLMQTDPTRTAEVDYYLQQVRRIVERTRQTQQWSTVYRKRLNIYLWAWLLLSALIVGIVTLYAGALADAINQLLATPDWWLIIQQIPVVLAGVFAGSLGASLSALIHIQRHSRRPFGFFDRKYGLRGLLLPLLGLFWGALLVVLWCVVYVGAGLDPVMYRWAILVPALLAFVLGFGQQWLYGAR